MLSTDSVSPWAIGMFDKAVVMPVLLYGSKSLNIIPLALQHLEGFHNRAAMKMARKHWPQQRPDGTWTYLASVDVQEEVGLHPIEHYICMWRNTMAQFIATWPIF